MQQEQPPELVDAQLDSTRNQPDASPLDLYLQVSVQGLGVVVLVVVDEVVV